MTESEYILVRDLSNIRHALEMLGQITPDNSIIVDGGKLQSITSQLYDWQDAHYAAIDKARSESNLRTD